MEEGEFVYFCKLVEIVVDNQVLIDQMIDCVFVVKWLIDCIDLMLWVLFCVVGVELVGKVILFKVVIVEFVQVVEVFYLKGKELKFVNVVLDYMVCEVQLDVF